MKHIYTFLIAFTVVTAISCGGKAGDEQTDNTVVNTPVSTNGLSQPDTTPQNTVASTNPVNSSIQTITAPNISTATNSAVQTTTGAGLNPAHGQPGHRCDIAVGAPLNGQLATPTPTTTTAAPVVQQTTLKDPIQASIVQPATQTVAAGMNPAHGQPGHRCDIAVGKPLNSAPTQTAASATPTINSNVTPGSLKPSIVNSDHKIAPATTPGKTAAGMNPAHGEPGHRCDIAVGSPLNSPPSSSLNVAAAETEIKKAETPPVKKDN